MSDPTAYQHLVERWQQAEDDELLIETDLIASVLAMEVEEAAQDAMERHWREEDAR